MKHWEIRIYGKVQGVGFRVWAKNIASHLGIYGFARNLNDASVEIIAEGEEKVLEQFLKHCKVGPSLAKVEKVEVNSGNLQNFKEFSIN